MKPVLSRTLLASLAAAPLLACGSSIQLGDSVAPAHGARFEYRTLYKYELLGAASYAESIADLTASLAEPGSEHAKETLTENLNQLGREGWELVAVVDEQVIFKRYRKK